MPHVRLPAGAAGVASGSTTWPPRSRRTRWSSSPARPAPGSRPSCRRSACRSVAACAARSATPSPGGSPPGRWPSGSPRRPAPTVGGAVGYAIRFGDHTGPDTLVKLMTDGILLNEIVRDRMLWAYDTIIIDEAHERSLNIDFLLGYLKELLPRRPDLKLIITSATIDPQRFSRHFGDAPIVEVSGRTYPGRDPLPAIRCGRPGRRDDDPEDDAAAGNRGGRAARSRTPAREEAIDQAQAICDAADELMARRRRRHPGLPVRRAGDHRHRRGSARATSAARRRRGGSTEVLPLYGRLSAADQHKVFSAHSRPADRAGHQRRRDLPDRPGYPLRHRPRHGADLPVLAAEQGAATADRTDLAGLRRAAGRPLRAGRRRHLHPAVLRGGLPGPAGVHRPGDRPHLAGLGDPADGVARSGRHRGLPVPGSARSAADHRWGHRSHRTGGAGPDRRRPAAADPDRPVDGRVAAGPPARQDSGRGQPARLSAGDAGHRGRAGHRRCPRVPAGGAGEGDRGALPVRRSAVGFQCPARSLGLPRGPGEGAVRQRLPQDVPPGVPELSADQGMAGPARPAAADHPRAGDATEQVRPAPSTRPVGRSSRVDPTGAQVGIKPSAARAAAVRWPSRSTTRRCTPHCWPGCSRTSASAARRAGSTRAPGASPS